LHEARGENGGRAELKRKAVAIGSDCFRGGAESTS
jgi:hypothetical protein